MVKCMQILFEDENLKVVFSAGNTDYLLVAFSPMNFSAKNSEDFYAKSIITNNNINAISITALKNHWYPQEFMNKILSSISNITKQFKIVIAYGVSMGGYAAIKYSAAISATHIISMMPQWSINPNEISENRYLKEYSQFSQYLENMSIKVEEMSGKLYLFFDKYYKEDKIQSTQILNSRLESFVFHTPFVGHTLGHILIGSEFFTQLVELILISNNVNLEKLVYNKIRKHPLKYQGVIRKALLSHKSLLLKVVNNLSNNHVLFKNPLFIEESKRILTLIKDKNQAFDLLTRFKFLDLLHILKIVTSQNQKGNLIYTAHQNFLCYNLLEEKLTLLTEDELKESIFQIPLKVHSDVGLLGCFIDNEFIPLMDIGNKKFALATQHRLSDIKNYKMQPFLFYRKISNFFVISNGVYHATATPKATVDFGKDHIKDWEKFTIKHIH